MNTTNFTVLQKKLIFLSCCIVVLTLMAMDFINPSLPYIMKDLSTTQSTIKGLMVMYMMVLGIAQLLYGSFSDNYGRKPAIILSFAIAIVGFVLSACSKNVTMLYFARFTTALGTAGGPVISRSIISDVCHDSQSLKKAFSYFSVSSQLSPGFAPVIGGLIQQYASWRFSFVVLALINLVSIYLFFKVMPESHNIPAIKKPFSEQLRINLSLFKLRRFQVFNLLSALIYVFTIVYYSLSPFIFHKMGISPLMNGFLNTIYAVGLASGAFALSSVLHGYDSEKTFFGCIIAYFLLFTISSVIFSFYIDLMLIEIFAFTLAFTCGIASPLTLSLCMKGFQEHKGAASAVQSFIKMFFTGIALLCFNFIELYRFSELMLFFLIISVIIILLYGTEHLFNKDGKLNP